MCDTLYKIPPCIQGGRSSIYKGRQVFAWRSLHFPSFDIDLASEEAEEHLNVLRGEEVEMTGCLCDCVAQFAWLSAPDVGLSPTEPWQ